MFKIIEIAKRLRISNACAYALIDAGKLSCFRIGVGRGTIRVSEEQLQAYLKSVEHESASAPTPRAKAFAFLPPPS
jgi:excisionase family DNA binding protein